MHLTLAKSGAHGEEGEEIRDNEEQCRRQCEGRGTLERVVLEAEEQRGATRADNLLTRVQLRRLHERVAVVAGYGLRR
jgi:hypothetical protein